MKTFARFYPRPSFVAARAEKKNDDSDKAVAAQTAISPICHYATRVAVYTRNIISVLVCYGLSRGVRGEGIRTTGKVRGGGWWHTKRCSRAEGKGAAQTEGTMKANRQKR